MPIDPRIPLLNRPRPDLMSQYGNALAIKGYQTQLDREGQEFQRQTEMRNRLAQTVSPSGEFDPSAAAAIYAQSGDIPGAMGIRQAQTAQRGAQLKELETKLNITARLLGNAKDQASYEQSLAVAQQHGLPTEGAPAQYDPVWVQQKLMETLDVGERIKIRIAGEGRDIQRESLEETRRAHRVAESRAAEETARQGTPAQRAVDTAFAKDYSDFVAGGGFADVKKNIKQLQDVKKELETGETITGPFVGRTPDWAKQMLGLGKAIIVRDAVEEVVQRNLRLILGAQFTEREGERLIARAYNPALDEKENAKRVGRLLESISRAAEAKISAAEYYEKNGTLQGWKGNLPNLSAIETSVGESPAIPTAINPQTGERMEFRNGQWVPAQ